MWQLNRGDKLFTGRVCKSASVQFKLGDEVEVFFSRAEIQPDGGYIATETLTERKFLFPGMFRRPK